MSGDTAEKVLMLLKTSGAQTAQAVARSLGVTKEAARQQLAKLGGQGLVEHVDRREKVGRPARYWQLSAKGHGRFPDRHAVLTLEMIDGVRRIFGADGLEQLIADREAAARHAYATRLSGCRTLAERVAALAEIRSGEGYMATWEEDGDGYLLIENHCPICAAAEVCQGFCRSELALFEGVLGAGVEVVRTDHLLAGARRCAYRIRDVAAAPGRD
jgi:predicted ArsR family transcriptional regulator